MEEVGSTRLTSLERVTTGVGSVSWAARWEADSHGRLLRPEVVVSTILTKIRYLLDSESMQMTKSTTLPQVKYDANSTPKTWENVL